MRIIVFFSAMLCLYAATAIAGQLLPPDPGEAGKQTLLGIDSDNNGVRDDIQRYIFFSYPDNERVRVALKHIAIQYQKLLPQANDREAAYHHAIQKGRHAECLFYILGEQSGDVSAALKAEILNTHERSIAYINFSNNLAGRTTMNAPMKEWENSCAFDVDAFSEN